MCTDEGTDARGANLVEKLKTHREVTIQASGLFTEAAQAFDVKAHTGAVLLCRAALEAMLYAFLTRSREGQPLGTWVVRAPLSLDGSLRRVDFAELIDAIQKRGVLSDQQLTNARRVQEHGNVGAHLAARWDRMVERATEKSPPWLWVSPDEAWRDLCDTLEVLTRLSEVLERRPDLAGPAHPASTKVETKLRLHARPAGVTAVMSNTGEDAKEER